MENQKKNLSVIYVASNIYSYAGLKQLRPEFFYFSFYRPSRSNFLEIEKKIRDFFFNFIFLFPSVSCSSVMFFSFCLFYCCQVD